MKRSTFEREAALLCNITNETLATACREEEQNRPSSDPAVKLLRKAVQGVLGRVIGSNESRYQMRSQIWSTSVYLGPPTIWMTINPSDVNNPIAQLFAGENVHTLQGVMYCTSDAARRARVIADDPFAAAKFFHFLIDVILQTLFQIRVGSQSIETRMGVLGRVSAYFGLVESQGRGTLHLHLLLWLCDTPASNIIHDLLTSTEFRE